MLQLLEGTDSCFHFSLFCGDAKWLIQGWFNQSYTLRFKDYSNKMNVNCITNDLILLKYWPVRTNICDTRLIAFVIIWHKALTRRLSGRQGMVTTGFERLKTPCWRGGEIGRYLIKMILRSWCGQHGYNVGIWAGLDVMVKIKVFASADNRTTILQLHGFHYDDDIS